MEADADEEEVVVNVETFFSSKADSFFAVVDFLLTILFLDEFSDQSFFASAADSIKVILWSELSALVLGFVCLHAEMSQYKFSLFSLPAGSLTVFMLGLPTPKTWI